MVSAMIRLVLVVLFLIAGFSPVYALDPIEFTVTSTADSPDALPGDGVCADAAGNCTLRAAIMEMNQIVSGGMEFDPQGDDFVITLPAGHYTLAVTGRGEDAAATGDLDILSQAIIVGAGSATIIDADGIDRVFHVAGGASLALRNLVVQGGVAEGTGFGAQGGGVLNEGSLYLERVLITENMATYGGGISNYGSLHGSMVRIAANQAQSSGGAGGGIYNGVSNDAVIDIKKSAIEYNTAGYSGGGINNSGNYKYYAHETIIGGNLTLSNVSIAHNKAQFGGGIALDPGSRAQLIHCTIVYNEGRGLVGNGAPSYDLFGNLVAWNKQDLVSEAYENCYQAGDSSRGLAHLNPAYFYYPDAPYGHNLSSDGSCSFSADRGGINSLSPVLSDAPSYPAGFPMVGTYVLRDGSPALDAIATNDAVVLEDLFGAIRPQGTGIDIGAHEMTPVSFAGGDGSVGNPFQIATAEQLNAVRNQLDAHYILVNDINLDVAPYNEGSGWEPIGVFVGYGDPDNAPFTGSLDGDGHEITHLFIDRPAENHAGLFGWASGARFSNLRLQVAITGNSLVGGLVGNIEPGSISNVHSTGSVVATANTAGGVAGRIRDTEITESSASVEVTGGSDLYGGGTDIGGLVGNVQNDSSIVSCFATGSVGGRSHRIGGLVGTLFSSSMTDSYATGDALGRESVGGLAGEHSGNSTIARCYATGAVSATDNGNTFFGGLVGNSNASIADAFATGRVDGVGSCGGLVGLNNTSASIARSYSVGQVIGTGESVGGLVGGNFGSVETSYYNSETSGQADLGKGLAATLAEMRQQSTFIDWTFPAVWKIAEGHTYPYLSWQSFWTLAPTLLSPTDQETLEGLSPTLAWLPAPNPDGGEIVRYQIQVATNSGFSGAVEYLVSAAGDVIPASLGLAALLLASGTLISGRRRVAVLIAGVALTALLINGCGGSSSSDRDLAADTESEALTLTLQTLDDSTTYYWRVRALDDQDQWSEWSQEWSFTTAGIL